MYLMMYFYSKNILTSSIWLNSAFSSSSVVDDRRGNDPAEVAAAIDVVVADVVADAEVEVLDIDLATTTVFFSLIFTAGFSF